MAVSVEASVEPADGQIRPEVVENAHRQLTRQGSSLSAEGVTGEELAIILKGIEPPSLAQALNDTIEHVTHPPHLSGIHLPHPQPQSSSSQRISPTPTVTSIEEARRIFKAEPAVEVSSLTQDETLRLVCGDPINLRPLSSAVLQAIEHILPHH